MANYPVTTEAIPPQENLQTAVFLPLAALVENAIKAMLASGELAIEDGLIVPADRRRVFVAIPTEAEIEL